MNLTKQDLRYLIKKVNKELEDFNNGKVNKSIEQLTDMYVLKEKLKAELARVLMNRKGLKDVPTKQTTPRDTD